MDQILNSQKAQNVLSSQKSYGVFAVITSALGEGYIFYLFRCLFKCQQERMNCFPDV